VVRSQRGPDQPAHQLGLVRSCNAQVELTVVGARRVQHRSDTRWRCPVAGCANTNTSIGTGTGGAGSGPGTAPTAVATAACANARIGAVADAVTVVNAGAYITTATSITVVNAGAYVTTATSITVVNAGAYITTATSITVVNAGAYVTTATSITAAAARWVCQKLSFRMLLQELRPSHSGCAQLYVAV
jgi:tetrahydrodipicolinate N-succinyltransferase